MRADDLRQKSRYAVIRALLEGTISPDEVMRSFDIFPSLADLEPDVAAFVYRSRKDRFYIIVNQHLSYETRQEVFFHELCHIIEDMPRSGYILGLDMQRHEIEIRADMFFREVAAAYQVAASK
ncbi:ImmA/IrrE family metallo-endopeptidase [Desulfofundulus salinus]|uniref:ImmA/IrrE family metallo-endopeptidase n=1 Tax=Desulfofundulus salinus TaxID=2419843 RepID=UPI000EAFF8F3|nr:hypothetical protein [Desulfofundulus salinum]